MVKADISKTYSQIMADFPDQSQPQLLDSLELNLKKVPFPKRVINVIGSPVTASPFDAQIKMILEWASNHESKVICVAYAHMLTEAYWQPKLSSILKSADLVTPDGMPLVWMMRLMGARTQNRVAGMDILVSVSKLAPLRNISVFFLGSEAIILEEMKKRLEYEFPDLKIVGMEPLPFVPLTPADNDAIVKKINESGAKVVFVSLGCPKQEYWINHHKDRIQAVMIGLGGVFPIVAGVYKRAPLWMRDAGLEWLFRLVQEPQRLCIRYIKTIPIFILLALKQILTSKY
jgi:N-acetylglucosaminyldiphosphoundecaprenol N-acetyl-beta-D-mannosaminyltransferase